MEATVATRIREARDAAGLTREQMAPMIGVTVSTLVRYEKGTGRRGISVMALARIATVTEKPLSWFLSENGDEAAA